MRDREVEGVPPEARSVRTAQERIAASLRYRDATVDELAAELGVTPSAIRPHLANMQRDGRVHVSGTRRGSTKPSQLYALTPSAQLKLSRAYVPLLTQILHVLSGRMSAREFDAFMREVGRGLLAGRPRPHGPAGARAQAASALLDELGGASEVVDADGTLWIRAHSCPLAVTTARHPEACHAVESLLGEFTGLDVANCCDRESRSRCCFEIRPSAGGRSSTRSR